MRSIGSIAMSLVLQQALPAKIADIFADDLYGMERFCQTRHLCESPIEEMMLAHLANASIDGGTVRTFIHDIQSGEEFPNEPFVVVPQFPIAKFRLDFFLVLVRKRRAWLFDIECDGINFHGGIDKRKEDYDRDTYLARMGVRTFRYFGQKIHSRQAKPEEDILMHIFNCGLAGDHGGT
jgi:very-short-patch-repair endonuclease